MLAQRPEHLREDFCGSALICGVWCRGDVRRTATGLDVDGDALAWGCRENGSGLLGEGGAAARLCLLHCNVLDPVRGAACVSAPPRAGGAQPPQQSQPVGGPGPGGPAAGAPCQDGSTAAPASPAGCPAAAQQGTPERHTVRPAGGSSPAWHAAPAGDALCSGSAELHAQAAQPAYGSAARMQGCGSPCALQARAPAPSSPGGTSERLGASPAPSACSERTTRSAGAALCEALHMRHARFGRVLRSCRVCSLML
jgi:hypothetical protein